MQQNQGVILGIYTYDDLYSEGKYALIYAIQKYDEKSGNAKSTFYVHCIKNYICTNVLRKELSKKRTSNINYTSLDKVVDEKRGTLLIDMIGTNKESDVIKYHLFIKETLLHHLTDIERKVFTLRMEGYTHEEIAKTLNVAVSSVPNKFIKSIGEKYRKYCNDEIVIDRYNYKKYYLLDITSMCHLFGTVHDIENTVGHNLDRFGHFIKTNCLFDGKYKLCNNKKKMLAEIKKLKSKGMVNYELPM